VTTERPGGARTTEPKPCPTGTLVGQTGSVTVLAPAYCKRWACHNCGPLKAKKLASRITATTATKFLTLTVRTDPASTPQETLDMMTRSWRALWKRIRRVQGERAKGYVRIVELTKAGNPHLHLALDCAYIRQGTLARWWRELTGSQIVDIRTIRSDHGLARYLSKYLTKAHETISHRRKWSQSSHFLPLLEKPALQPDELPVNWRWWPATVATIESMIYDPTNPTLATVYVVPQTRAAPKAEANIA